MKDMDTMFSLKVAQGLQLHFRREKFKKRHLGFFLRRRFEKTQFLSVFHFEPLNLRTANDYKVHGLENCSRVFRLHFSPKKTLKFFHSEFCRQTKKDVFFFNL